MKNIDESVTKFDVIRELASIFHSPDYDEYCDSDEPMNFDVFLYGGKDDERPHLGSGMTFCTFFAFPLNSYLVQGL